MPKFGSLFSSIVVLVVLPLLLFKIFAFAEFDRSFGVCYPLLLLVSLEDASSSDAASTMTLPLI